MNSLDILALLAIGGGLGLVLALVAVMVYAIYHLAATLRRTASRSLAQVAEVLKAQEMAISHLRTEVSQALARVDAERLYAASLAIQRASKSLGAQTAELQRVLFAQPGHAPALDLAGGLDYGMSAGMEPEDEINSGSVDPLAGLTPDEREQRVQQFFAARNRERVGRPGSGNQQDIRSVAGMAAGTGTGAPPAFGSGAYAALAEEAARLQSAAPIPVPADFSGVVTDAGDGMDSPEGVDLSDKGELG